MGSNYAHHVQPRRVLHPLRRAGERGENKWEVISWDEAVEEAATHICDAIDKYGPYAFFASVGGGGAYSFMEAMTLPMAFRLPRCSSRAAQYLLRWSLSKLTPMAATTVHHKNSTVQEIFTARAATTGGQARRVGAALRQPDGRIRRNAAGIARQA